MSEIKGQLLGIVLVVAIFAAVGGVLLGAFKTAASNTAEKIKEQPTIQEPVEAHASLDSNLLSF